MYPPPTIPTYPPTRCACIPCAQEFTSTFFNKTSDIVETPSWVDFELLGLYSGFAAGLAAIGA